MVVVTPGKQNQALQVGEADFAFVVTGKVSKQKRLRRLLASSSQKNRATGGL